MPLAYVSPGARTIAWKTAGPPIVPLPRLFWGLLAVSPSSQQCYRLPVRDQEGQPTRGGHARQRSRASRDVVIARNEHGRTDQYRMRYADGPDSRRTPLPGEYRGRGGVQRSAVSIETR
jgi:hypothetical protein